MGKNRSSVTAGAGGDLSLLIWENDPSGVYDAGLGYSGANSGAVNGLTIKNGLGNINHFCGTKNVCQMTANGINNAVLKPQVAQNSPVTATTELGLKPWGYNTDNLYGFEVRFNATALRRFCFGRLSTDSMYMQASSDNGVTWTGWQTVLHSDNTGWV
jgi:hypothetical protein